MDRYTAPPVFERRATVRRVVDGDTLWISADLGCDTSLAMTVRLYGLNTPEMNTVEGKAAKAYVEHWVAEYGPRFLLRTERDHKEKYGRWLVDLLPESGDRDSLCTALLTFRYALPYDGGKR